MQKMEAIYRLFNALYPKVGLGYSFVTTVCSFQQIASECESEGVTDQNGVLELLKDTTMVGILPVPHPIVIRTYQQNAYTQLWFTSYLWGVIFTRSQALPLYDWKKIQLILINQ